MTDAGPRGTQQTTMNGDAERVEPIEGDGTAPLDAAALAAERDAFLDQLQRSRAEFANFRRRTDQERAQIREIANQALLTQLLPVLDDFRRALAAVPEAERDAALVQGLSLIERKFWGVLERAGVAPIEALGKPFDPAEHEAVESVPGTAADTVVGVYQDGYRLGQTLLRPAMVKVGGSQQSSGAGGHDAAADDDPEVIDPSPS
ncbi:MAG: nucleotide exchange factor GrpE [Chloroflexota bacterium]|nr:nucleotide exchange factor GrpE [Chloroflexota bacterium]